MDSLYWKFSIYKIEFIDNVYTRKRILEENISYQNKDIIFHNIRKLKNDYEYSFFLSDRNIEYDEKIKGGRFIYKLKNSFNNFNKQNQLKNVLSSQLNNPITPCHQIFFNIIFLMMSYKLNNDFLQSIIRDNSIYYLLLLIEGVIFQKNNKNIKIVISIDNNLNTNDIEKLFNFFKKLFMGNDYFLMTYSTYKNHEYITMK